MKKFLLFLPWALGFFALMAPLALAQAAVSVSIGALSPGASVIARDRLTFIIAPVGFVAQTYSLTDSYQGSSAATSDISGAGNFFWVPLPSDVGTHTFTITASDFSGDSASVTQTITVQPAPSLTIGPVSPDTSILPGTRFSFVVSASGLTNPSYSISDAFSGSSISNTSIDSAGNFSWTPDLTQDGDHSITISAYDSLGHSASVVQSVHVGAGPMLSVILLSPGASVPVGTTTSFRVTWENFAPSNFSVSDSFPGSTVSNNNITSGGFFSWMPQASDVGTHLLTIKGIVGIFGQSTTTTQTITVTGSGVALPVTAAPTTTSASSFVFTSYLHPGVQSDEVYHLQTLLIQQGFLLGAPTGYYGSLTVDAVAKFQAAHGLAQLGVVGPATRAALNALQSGTQTAAPGTSTASSSGDGYIFNNFMGFGEDPTDGIDVLELQKRLSSLGFFSGQQSGYFGSATQEAVKQFQTARDIPPTGYVGSQTRAALNK